MTKQRFLSAADVAEVLGVEPRAVLELITSGALAAVRVAGSWRVEESVLQNWINDEYEAQRRAALWNESQGASVTDLFGPR